MKKSTRKKSTVVAKTPEAIATAIAGLAAADPLDAFGVMLDANGPLFDDLVRAIAGKDVVADLGAAYAHVKAVLPEQHHRVLLDYDTAAGHDRHHAMNAAFVLGMAYGRQTGGAR